MNDKQIEKNRSDWLVWGGIIVVLISALMITYMAHFPVAIKFLIWIVWLVLTLALGYFTNYGKQVLAFGREAQIELQKVSWPTRQETLQTTSIVICVVAITGFVLWGVDAGMMWIIGKITHLG